MLILITPRPPAYTAKAERSPRTAASDSMNALREKFGFTNSTPSSVEAILHQLKSNEFFREFRQGDVSLERWDRAHSTGDRLLQALLASCALTVGFNAEAKCKSFSKCMKSGTDSVKDAGNSGISATQKAANDAKDLADKTAKTLADQGAAISKTEMTSLLNDAKGAYADSASAVKSGYDSSLKLLNGLLDGIWREAGKKFTKKNGAFILDMKHRAQSLDAEGQAALNRVKRAITQKDLDEQARADMQVLMKKIVMTGNNIPDSIKNSSFGIQLCASAGVGYGGVFSNSGVSLKVRNLIDFGLRADRVKKGSLRAYSPVRFTGRYWKFLDLLNFSNQAPARPPEAPPPWAPQSTPNASGPLFLFSKAGEQFTFGLLHFLCCSEVCLLLGLCQ